MSTDSVPALDSGPPTHGDLAVRIAEAALELGFVRVGFARVERFEAAGRRLETWLASGYHGDLDYLERPDDRADPGALLPEAKTLVAVALSYGGTPIRAGREGPVLAGSVGRYARGEDYHLVMKQKLAALAARCEELAGRPLRSRVCVDTAPLLEHEVARAAGIGFSGKSTLTIVPGVGTWVVLGELLLDLELPAGEPIRQGCGSCRLCLDACPTGAFVGPHVLDARRCISYLTIENDGAIPRELRAPIGTRVFGCDVCQDVCPWNQRFARDTSEPAFLPDPDAAWPSLEEILVMQPDAFEARFGHTALERPGLAGLQRNARVVLENR